MFSIVYSKNELSQNLEEFDKVFMCEYQNHRSSCDKGTLECCFSSLDRTSHWHEIKKITRSLKPEVEFCPLELRIGNEPFILTNLKQNYNFWYDFQVKRFQNVHSLTGKVHFDQQINRSTDQQINRLKNEILCSTLYSMCLLPTIQLKMWKKLRVLK